MLIGKLTDLGNNKWFTKCLGELNFVDVQSYFKGLVEEDSSKYRINT